MYVLCTAMEELHLQEFSVVGVQGWCATPRKCCCFRGLRDEDWGVGGSVTAELFIDHWLKGLASRGRETIFQARETAHLLSVRG